MVDPALDGARIFAESEGNPLFAIELAHAHRRGEAEPGPTFETVVAGQLARLSEEAREALLWAAAHGRAFTPDDLARAGRVDTAHLLAALGELERRGIVRPVSEEAYDFAHDLVRQATYRTVSQPRRRLLHRHIARGLEATGDGALAADLAYHAALAGEDETAARACAVAGERALRLFANVEAGRLAERGLRHVERLADGAAKVEMHIALLKLRILAAAGPGMRPLPRLIDTVATAAEAAETLGLQAAAATAHYLLSVLHQEAGDTRSAETSTLRAAAAGRAADEPTRAHQLANTARCLLELESEVDRARALIREAGGIVDESGLELCELHWARGLLLRWDGEAEAAVASISRALALARTEEDRWREYKCLTWLAMLAQELGRYDDMRARCGDLGTVAARLGEDETPFVATLQGLALLAAEDLSAGDVLADALGRLRSVDDKSYLAYALNSAARLHMRAGRVDQARLCAAEALDAASAMRRRNEVTIARAMLAQAGEAASATDGAAAVDRNGVSARGRATLRESAERRARFQREFPR
jgi:tetratricopeptide (TPR) repeat protein